MAEFHIEPLTREKYLAYEGEPPPYTMKGIAIMHGDRVACICCLVPGKNLILFDAKDCSTKMLLKGWKVFKKIIEGKICFAQRDMDKPTSARFLEHFGFTHFSDDLYLWRG